MTQPIDESLALTDERYRELLERNHQLSKRFDALSEIHARMFEELERAHRELKEAQDRLLRAEKLASLGEMAAGVAHDFNNILSAILGRAQMLKVMLASEETLKSVRVIETAALDGANAVRRIQEFVKAESESAFVSVHLNALVRDTVELVTPRLGDLACGLDLAVELGEMPAIRGSPSEIREVLTNLLHNAIDAMPRGGRLTIRTGTERGRPFFEVEDTGVGMDEETKSRIFDPFFTTKGKRGTGLGMSVSCGIIQHHDGEFVVRSRVGEGTRVRVLLPAAGPDHAPVTIGGDSVPSPEGSAPGTSRERARILVIDDDVAVRDVLADILRAGDHEVVAVSTGHEGLEASEARGFDLVLTDLGMPEMNGWEVAKGIKAMNPSTVVGLITGWGASLDEANLRDRGVDLVLSKPFRYEQVLALVRQMTAAKDRARA